MKGFSKLTLGLLVAALMVAGPRTEAQSFGLSVTPSANSIMVSNSLVYTINITNLAGSDLYDVQVTNSFSAPIQYITSSASQSVGFTNNATNVTFDLGPVAANIIAQVILTIQTTATGSLSNFVTVAVPGAAYVTSTNVVVQVTNVVTEADLGVAMTGPQQVVITNDWMTYGVTVTNAGPNDAVNVVLTNIVPTGVIGISSPIQNSGTNPPISLGTLVSGGSTNLFFLVEPTNVGVLSFSASAGTATPDTNTANNVASTNITVTNYLSGPFGISTNSSQNYNAQNGLVEQFVSVTNNTNYAADAVRVVVTGLTSTNSLFNSVGTNSGNPFVYYSARLDTNQTVSLLLQYAASVYFPLTNGQLQAFAVPMPNWTPPPITATSTNINLSRIVQLANGDVLIEWPSTAGKTYTVVYGNNLSFSNAMIAPPSVIANGSRKQWIDYGPPTTASLPTNASRFYRVYQNP